MGGLGETIGWVVLALLLLVTATVAALEVALALGQVGSRAVGASLAEARSDAINALALLRYGSGTGYVLSAWQSAQTMWPGGLGLTRSAIVLTITVTLLLLAQLVGTALGRRHAAALIVTARIVSRVVQVIFGPLVVPISLVSRALGRRLGGDGAVLLPMAMVEQRHAEVGLRPSRELVSSLLEFADTVAREIMVPRTSMVSAALDTPTAELQKTLIDAGHARVPIFDETADNIIGLLHVRDFFAATLGKGGEVHVRTLLRPTFYIPEVMKISELLREFQRRKTHMAIVVDEYGGTAGLVTLEDVLEVIVGDIHDEHDVEEKKFKKVADGKVLADGRVSLWDLEGPLDVKFPSDGDFETLGGLVVSLAGYLPKTGATFEWHGLKLTVKETDERRIKAVEIERLDKRS